MAIGNPSLKIKTSSLKISVIMNEGIGMEIETTALAVGIPMKENTTPPKKKPQL